MAERTLAFDQGGTRLKAGVVQLDEGGHAQVVTLTAIPAAPTGPEALDSMAAIGAELASSHGCTAVGLAVPGIVDGGRVVALAGKLPGLAGLDLLGWARRTFGLDRAVVANDAVASAVGEAQSRPELRTLVVTVGTGIGVALVDKRHPPGQHPLDAGILGGGIPMEGESTIETWCRADQIVACAHQAGGSYADVADVYAGCRAGHPAAVDGVDIYRRRLARALVALVSAHAPDAVILGGGAMTASPVVDGLAVLVRPYLHPGVDPVIALSPDPHGAALRGLGHLVTSDLLPC